MSAANRAATAQPPLTPGPQARTSQIGGGRAPDHEPSEESEQTMTTIDEPSMTDGVPVLCRR